jgi:hypothetical protein
MFSKTQKGDLPIAFDNGDKKLVYYDPKRGEPRLNSIGLFRPWFWGDAVVYVSGRRGCGKSTYCNEYIKSYVNATDGKVFFISRFQDDPSITLPERSMRLDIVDLVGSELSDLTGSLIVFDDIHSSSYSKKEIQFLHSYILDVIQNSRHFNISCLITSHMISNYQKTRDILAELSALVIFPNHSTGYQITRALRVYIGLSKKQINDIFELQGTRWVHIQVIGPKFILTQKEVFGYK